MIISCEYIINASGDINTSQFSREKVVFIISMYICMMYDRRYINLKTGYIQYDFCNMSKCAENIRLFDYKTVFLIEKAHVVIKCDYV